MLLRTNAIASSLIGAARSARLGTRGNAAVETVSQSPDNLAEHLDHLRQVGPDALVYMGYGMLAAKGLMRAALESWNPETPWIEPRA